MTNRLHDVDDKDLIYVLQAEDIRDVARLNGIPATSVTPAVLRSVQKGIEAYFGDCWQEVVLTGLQGALGDGHA